MGEKAWERAAPAGKVALDSLVTMGKYYLSR